MLEAESADKAVEKAKPNREEAAKLIRSVTFLFWTLLRETTKKNFFSGQSTKALFS